MRSIVAVMRGVYLVVLLGCVRPTPPDPGESFFQDAELRRAPSAEVRALLASPSAAVRQRAEIAVGRLGDPAAIDALGRLLDTDAEAAWALGRIEGGTAPLLRCLERNCPTAPAAARAWAGPASAEKPATAALVQALGPIDHAGDLATGPAAAEAAFALGVLARNKDAQFPDLAVRALAAALGRDDARAGAAYALSRVPAQKAAGLEAALRGAMASSDGWTRSLAARAWGHQELPAAGLEAAFEDADWRVRVEAARGLPTAPGAAGLFAKVLPRQANEHVRTALFEAAVQIGPAVLEALPDRPCAAALARDRIRKQLLDTPRCAPDADWRQRARVAALAAELGLPTAAFDDPDGRVRAAAAGAALAGQTRKLLADPDPYVVQEAAAALAHDAASRDAAASAEQRLAAARDRWPGDPEYDALVALSAITGRALPKRPPRVPPEARAAPEARRLRIRTSRGELVVDLRPDLAPLTSSALAALAKKNFFSSLTFHRVVPDFVVQGGDPRGDGDGGPGWTIPDEHSPARFVRGTLGIATSGPETGGSQFFLCHSPQPHLDGRYTIAGQLREGDDVLDALQPGDTILSVTAE
ncbi:MAG: peptidylprolyl isomerase [Myxococcales bacterium]